MEMRDFDLISEKKWATQAARGRSGSMRWPWWVNLIQHPSVILTATPSFVGSIFSSGASNVTTCAVHPVWAMPSMSTSSTIFARGATVFEELCSKIESIKLILSELSTERSAPRGSHSRGFPQVTPPMVLLTVASHMWPYLGLLQLRGGGGTWTGSRATISNNISGIFVRRGHNPSSSPTSA